MVMEKSTPLGPLKCPRIGLEGGVEEDHVVTSAGGNLYECSCGEEFEWSDQVHWERVTNDEPNTPTS